MSTGKAPATSWDPAQYLTFANERLRPALDLLQRVPELAADNLVDLGCGAGTVTPYLRARWPEARIIGVDSSPEMLARARDEMPKSDGTPVAWQEANIADWQPDRAPALIYSNAALHWLPDHTVLFSRLLACLASGGVLAVQMPQSGHGAWRDVIRDVARDGPWAADLADLLGPGNVLGMADYHGMLASETTRLDIWESEYLHVLTGDDPVAAWTRGAGLRPFLARLEGKAKEDFFAAYRAALRPLYPRRPEGHTLLPFRRLFIVAQRKP